MLGLTAAIYPHVTRAQATKIPHVGYLSTGSLKSNRAFLDALRDALRELGYIDGKNIAIDVRWAGDMPSEFPQLAASLVRDNPNAIVTTCIPSTRAAKQATSTLPIVMVTTEYDPLKLGEVYKLGASAICHKSFDPHLVRNIVMRLFI